MRNNRLLVGALSVGLSVGAWQASGQETQPSDPVKPNASTNKIDAPALPPIPLSVISRATWSIPEADKLGLTKKQRDDLSTFVTAHYQELVQERQKRLTTPASNGEAFKKQSDEFHRKMTEHSTAVSSAVWDKLTPEQRDQLEKLTGLRPPPKSPIAD